MGKVNLAVYAIIIFGRKRCRIWYVPISPKRDSAARFMGSASVWRLRTVVMF